MAENDKESLLSITSTAESPLTAVRIVAHETISQLFEFEIEVVATGEINTTKMLNKPACVAVNHGGKSIRYFHGIVSEFGLLEQSGVFDKAYRMVLVPQLAQAAIRSDCRMFFNKTAQDILKIIFDDAGVTKTAFRLYSQPAQRKATAQFNETSLHFATRLMEEEGWYYFFEHTSDSHTLVVTNDNNGFYTIPGTTLRLGVGTTADMITEYRKPELLTTGKVTVKDYDFDAPDKNLKMEQNTILKHAGISNRAVFLWPAAEPLEVADSRFCQMMGPTPCVLRQARCARQLRMRRIFLVPSKFGPPKFHLILSLRPSGRMSKDARRECSQQPGGLSPRPSITQACIDRSHAPWHHWTV